MLAANEAVARLIKNQQVPCIYRIHEDPDADKLFEFRELARIHSYQIGDLSNRAEIQKLLRMVTGKPEERLIKVGLLKSLKRAAYHADPLGHYGLAKLDYTHFTSPIRRYADLIVHRVLGNAMHDLHPAHERQILEKTSVPSYPGLLEIAKHISDTERSASAAEEESKKLKMLEFFDGLVRKDSDRTFEALILEVARIGIFVELEHYFVRGLIRKEDLPPNSDWYFDLQSQRVFGKHPKVDYQTGDEIEVRVAKVDFEKMFLDFRIV
jgi:ribonuclease R